MRAGLQLFMLLAASAGAIHGKALGPGFDVRGNDVSEIRGHAGLQHHRHTTAAASDSPGFRVEGQQLQAGRHLTQAPATSNSSSHGTPSEHKPLFPVGSLDIAILVIAGVVLFIAAGKSHAFSYTCHPPAAQSLVPLCAHEIDPSCMHCATAE